jgi:FKBP-type peptidyl-prolyl cis-trans isomerase (trigger factor)
MPKTNNVHPSQASARFDINIPQAEVKQAYQEVLKSVQAKTEIKGFRKGKAPLDIVEQSADKSKLYELVFENLFPKKYQQTIIDKKLEPVAAPKVTVKEAKPDGDWTFDVEIALRPIVELGEYKDAVKSAFSKEKIWTPGKTSDKKPEEKTRDQKLNQIFDILLKTVKVDISPLLIEDETNRSLSQLLDQVDKLGLTLDKYVTSLNKTIEELKKEQQLNAEATLKLEYILIKISEVEKLTATEEQYQEFLKTVKNAETLKQLETDPNTQSAIRYTLTKRQVVDFLINLIG